MTDTRPLPLVGMEFLADLSGALFWPAESTLVITDLHLEKGSSFADRRRPQFIPPYDTAATLIRIESLLDRFAPRRVICLGDSVHDPRAPARIDPDACNRIRARTRGRDWIWIAGNHDPEPPKAWGGAVLREVAIGPALFRHQAHAMGPEDGTIEISGHFHPTAAVATRAARVSGRCFAYDGRRLLLPAFGAYAGGLSVRDPAIAQLFKPEFTVVVLGRQRLFTFPSATLVG